MNPEEEDQQPEKNTDTTKIERKLSQSTYEQLKKLNEYILNGVRFVKRSSLGPITIHSTGSVEPNPPSKKLLPSEESQAIAAQSVPPEK